MVIISKFCNPENPGIEPQNPGIELALKSCGIPGLDSLLHACKSSFPLAGNVTLGAQITKLLYHICDNQSLTIKEI
jgi:hypothetical protein